jgi:hypothetical protein
MLALVQLHCHPTANPGGGGKRNRVGDHPSCGNVISRASALHDEWTVGVEGRRDNHHVVRAVEHTERGSLQYCFEPNFEPVFGAVGHISKNLGLWQ